MRSNLLLSSSLLLFTLLHRIHAHVLPPKATIQGSPCCTDNINIPGTGIGPVSNAYPSDCICACGAFAKQHVPNSARATCGSCVVRVNGISPGVSVAGGLIADYSIPGRLISDACGQVLNMDWCKNKPRIQAHFAGDKGSGWFEIAYGVPDRNGPMYSTADSDQGLGECSEVLPHLATTVPYCNMTMSTNGSAFNVLNQD